MSLDCLVMDYAFSGNYANNPWFDDIETPRTEDTQRDRAINLRKAISVAFRVLESALKQK